MRTVLALALGLLPALALAAPTVRVDPIQGSDGSAELRRVLFDALLIGTRSGSERRQDLAGEMALVSELVQLPDVRVLTLRLRDAGGKEINLQQVSSAGGEIVDAARLAAERIVTSLPSSPPPAENPTREWMRKRTVGFEGALDVGAALFPTIVDPRLHLTDGGTAATLVVLRGGVPIRGRALEVGPEFGFSFASNYAKASYIDAFAGVRLGLRLPVSPFLFGRVAGAYFTTSVKDGMSEVSSRATLEHPGAVLSGGGGIGYRYPMMKVLHGQVSVEAFYSRFVSGSMRRVSSLDGDRPSGLDGLGWPSIAGSVAVIF